MANLAIIPARGGSKRIPGKNIKDFMGKPIIAYSIETALKSELFDEVMVSTDNNEIATMAQKYGAHVPFLRSDGNSDDFATTIDVLKEVCNCYGNQINKFENVCCIYPTAPLIKAEHLKTGLKQLISNNFKSVFPVIEFSYPIWRGLKINNSGNINMVWPEYLTSRSQDLEKVYHDAGQWYWIKTMEIKDSLFTDNSGSIVLSEIEVQDIDNLSDWKIAELKYKLSLEV